jgi:hypothetical protein
MTPPSFSVDRRSLPSNTTCALYALARPPALEMDSQLRDNSLVNISVASGSRLDHSDTGEADTEDNRLPSRGETPKPPSWGGPERASAGPSDLDKCDPQEHGILAALHDTILENFPEILRRLAEGTRAPGIQAGADDGSTDVNTEPISLPISKPSTASQHASLQRAFIRFHIWGRDFEVANGTLEKKLEYSEDLKEDIILVLLQLCDAVYQGKCIVGMRTAKAHQRLTCPRSFSSHEEWICHRSRRAAECDVNYGDCQVLRWRV